MKRWIWTSGLGVALALLLTVFLSLRLADDEHLAHLPPSEDEELPAALRERIHAAREAVSESSGESTAVRELARLYYANHRYAEARLCFKMLASTSSGLTAQDRYHLANIALHLGDLAQAQSELEIVLEQEPGYLPARVALGLALLKSGQAERAANEFTAVLAREPRHIEATVNLARLDLQRGDESSAMKRLEQLITARPESTSAIALLAQLAERHGETDRAVALRERSQQRPEPIAPDPWMAELDAHVYDLRLLGLRFEELSQAGESERARTFLRRMEEIEPGSPFVPLLQAAVAARGRRHEEAVSHLRTALARGGDPEKICPVLVTSLLALGQTEAALSLMADYYAKLPTSVPVLVSYAEVLATQKDRPEARQILTQALERQPYLVSQGMALAEILWADGEYDSAAGYLQRVAQVDAEHLASRALLAEYSLQQSDHAAALGWLEQVQALSPADPEIRQRLAALRFAAHVFVAQRALSEGDAQRALRHFDQAATVSPDEPQVHAARAQLLTQLGDYNRAAEALEKLAELQPDNPTVLLSLGDLRQRQGRVDLAIRHWTAARDLVAPDDHRLRAAVDQRFDPVTTSDTPK